ncbi:MAG: hypothetical protein VX941_00235 [Pseudomonadota bacterium]|nr:hypothetical protein [Pseudomonadota bacterium]
MASEPDSIAVKARQAVDLSLRQGRHMGSLKQLAGWAAKTNYPLNIKAAGGAQVSCT